jgi:FkbM family methyltransferase
MRRLIGKFTRTIAAGFFFISQKVTPPSPYVKLQEERSRKWFADEGDKTLRLDYDLDESSIVFDLGGYEGQWASDLFSMYCCSIRIFEPVEEFALNIGKRFSKNRKITLHKFGLSSETTNARIALGNDGSSIFKSGDQSEDISLVRAIDFMHENSISKIDLMKINIEGGEYDLLEHLIESGFVNKIKDIQVQFHDFIPDAESRMHDIQKQLERTHRLTYQYEFVWENWRIKETA